jgi:hypothetical protein
MQMAVHTARLHNSVVHAQYGTSSPSQEGTQTSNNPTTTTHQLYMSTPVCAARPMGECRIGRGKTANQHRTRNCQTAKLYRKELQQAKPSSGMTPQRWTPAQGTPRSSLHSVRIRHWMALTCGAKAGKDGAGTAGLGGTNSGETRDWMLPQHNVIKT